MVSGLAAVATTALLLSTLVNSFDARLLIRKPDASQADAPVVATLRRDAADGQA
jgi:hypothetical protein